MPIYFYVLFQHLMKLMSNQCLKWMHKTPAFRQPVALKIITSLIKTKLPLKKKGRFISKRPLTLLDPILAQLAESLPSSRPNFRIFSAISRKRLSTR